MVADSNPPIEAFGQIFVWFGLDWFGFVLHYFCFWFGENHLGFLPFASWVANSFYTYVKFCTWAKQIFSHKPFITSVKELLKGLPFLSIIYLIINIDTFVQNTKSTLDYLGPSSTNVQLFILSFLKNESKFSDWEIVCHALKPPPPYFSN